VVHPVDLFVVVGQAAFVNFPDLAEEHQLYRTRYSTYHRSPVVSTVASLETRIIPTGLHCPEVKRFGFARVIILLENVTYLLVLGIFYRKVLHRCQVPTVSSSGLSDLMDELSFLFAHGKRES
jgi:hypothetical protein